MSKDISIAVVGAGAIGGITAAFLSRKYDTEIVCKYEDKAAEVRDKGIHIVGVSGELHIKMNAVAEIDQLSGKKDVIFVVTKAYDMPDAAKSALPFLKDDGVMVSMQNGICVDAMAEIVGKDRTVGCMVGWGSTMLQDGTLNMTNEGEFVIGGVEQDMDVSGIKAMLDNVMPTRMSDNILSDLYSKMIINSCITAMGVLSGLYLGEILAQRRARCIFIAIIKEAMDVADAMGLRVLPYGGKIDYYELMKGEGLLGRFKRQLIIRILGIKYRKLKSSTLQALKRGKPTEIDYYNGYVARKGAQYGVQTPVNSRVVQMIKEIEAGTRKSTPNNFDDEGLKMK